MRSVLDDIASTDVSGDDQMGQNPALFGHILHRLEITLGELVAVTYSHRIKQLPTEEHRRLCVVLFRCGVSLHNGRYITRV
jgi:hypothetical protein